MAKKMNPIDRILKEKLEGMQVPFDAGSWQLMEQKLEEEPIGMEGQQIADIKDIDEAVFEKLHRYSAPYHPGHWKRMEALLEEAFAWPRQVQRYKLAEMMLMLLLFLLLWQYAPTAGSGSPIPRALESTPSATPAAENPTTTRGAADMAPQAALSGKKPNIPDGFSMESASPLAGTAAEGGAGIVSGSGALAPGDALPAKGVFSAGKDIEKASSSLFAPLAPVALRPSSPEAPKYALPEKATSNTGSLAELFWLETLPGKLSYDGLRDIGESSFIKNKSRIALRVGMFGSAEYNHITVPSSEEKKLENELQRYAMGYGGGLSLGMGIGRFEIETGAIYAARQYPVGLLYVKGSVGSGLQGQLLEASELNIINVPLHFRYNFLHRGSWRAYALAGASLQVAFQRNYYVTDDPQFDFLPMQPPPSPAPPAPADESSTIDRIRRSGLGWFEGGTFEENAYLTGNLGLGLERYINSRWSLFVQPTYQHSLQYFRVGLGPNADQINSLSVLFGAKVRVK